MPTLREDINALIVVLELVLDELDIDARETEVTITAGNQKMRLNMGELIERIKPQVAPEQTVTRETYQDGTRDGV